MDNIMVSNSSENIVIWEKWRDPFGHDEEYHMLENKSIDSEEDEIEDGSLSYQDNSDDYHPKNIRVMATPMGIIPVTEYTASGKIFNFWTGHTNFDITEKIAGLIEKIDGVEALDIFTRYRFRIGIGKAFNDSAVMRNITNKVYKYLAKT